MYSLILILGVALWSGAHLFKRIAPERRAALGDGFRGPVSLMLLASLVLMVIGYRGMDGAFFWGRHPATVGINNLLMLVSVYLFAASGMKTAMGQKMRHPMLIGVKTWALAHLLVNGDVASFILFGGLLAWAVVEVILINKQTTWVKPATVTVNARKEVMALVGTLVVYGVAVGIHYWLGYPTFG
ncbi:NnrU family protein [Mesobacterium sp. TK19101]|uniref:NnrU family protein n=1 Tax=Mesobacterium hydrothermale TaxID=3111907 RepID=A0ABU6HC51_9RHOB|nr:NnrU family protein [Mesobacterium sp. TK19101]MEC3859841.1 NnrU family protein [Mesobacterium sp. TK19101]